MNKTLQSPRRQWFATVAISAPCLLHFVPCAAVAETLPPPVVVESTSDIQLGQPVLLEPEPERPHRHSFASDIGIFVDSLDLSDVDLTFSGAEIDALNGSSLDASAFRSLVTGGVSFGFGGRLWQVLRFPELRFTLGGASFDIGSVPLSRGDAGLSVGSDSLFLYRIELGAGLQYRLGPVTPFVMVRGSWAGYVFDVHVSHRELGSLGGETVSGGAWEVATDAGLGIELADSFELGLAWRHTWVGCPSDGVMLTLSVDTR
jgi:hypothetical protein